MDSHAEVFDDPGTVLESFTTTPPPVPAAVPMAPAGGRVRGVAPPVEEVMYRSPYRWKAPQVTICEDGSLDAGEIVHVRKDRFVIGRTRGDILIGHDAAMSSRHAELVRKVGGVTAGWFLRDLGSSNGTFARARSVTLRPGVSVIIGSKRLLFEDPTTTAPKPPEAADAGTAIVADAGPATAQLPAFMLRSAAPESGPVRLPFMSSRVTIGRPGIGNDIELDDAFVAALHAVVTRDARGQWQLEPQRSINGVWVKIETVRLVDGCLFQCGEQRFRFRE